jgi:hypothetical protein
MSPQTDSVIQPAPRETLASHGFTPEQIERLEALRAVYPVQEFVTSPREHGRLRFLKWMRANGRITD